ncbi:MAG: hypothetical protein E5X89_09450 [Mesorhizobium sp.]|nr:MAG: hypothetical protein E5X88_02110 [Mesorhizobium sp.]TIO35453.1 MAG: hypothetical protein E5X89_09450 [Mesorhizobium sp.]TIP13508.1 MAG: hypothetical protein E5X73_08820 [Mesorhizobium sp.]
MQSQSLGTVSGGGAGSRVDTLPLRPAQGRSAPNRYGLGAFYETHVWAWKGNPTGTFADMNPNVSCDPTAAPSQ